MSKSLIVFPDSEEAASIQTVTGWVDRHGRFWGKDERMARYCGATHLKCSKYPEHEIYPNNSYCISCYEESRITKYKEFCEVVFQNNYPIVIFDTDSFFWDEDSLVDHLYENDLNLEDVFMCPCYPQYAEEINPYDHYVDNIVDGCDLPREVEEAFEVLNNVLKKSSPVSYWRDDKRLVFTPEFLSHIKERVKSYE